MQEVEEIIEDIQSGVIIWYDFRRGARLLYIGAPEHPVARALKARELVLTCAELEMASDAAWQGMHQNSFDYIVSLADAERAASPIVLLCAWKKLLKVGGRMLLGMNNRLGIRYFCGDRDPYTRRNFDGIENYRLVPEPWEGRMYSQNEICQLLDHAGWRHRKFFSVLPDLQHAALIYAEDYLPNEDVGGRVFPKYNYPDTVFLEEASLYKTLQENGLFHKMANSYLIECSLGEEGSDICHVTCSLERGRENALLTVIHKDGRVEKKAVYEAGRERIRQLENNMEYLRMHGIHVVPAVFKHNCCVMSYVEAETGQLYLERLLRDDKEKFIKAMDHFRDLILRSADHENAELDKGIILQRGCVDMVPLNSFFVDGEFMFFDQEFSEENCPANLIIRRMLASFYAGKVELEHILPMRVLMERYDLVKQQKLWQQLDWSFISKLRNINELAVYHEKCQGNGTMIYANRQRINYPEAQYQRLFLDIFKDAERRKLILFGSGAYARRLLALYGKEYPVAAIVDNNPVKWGTVLEGIKILSPDILRTLSPGEYKVIVCIKAYLPILRQLEGMGITEYSIFDVERDYPKKKTAIELHQEFATVKTPKKYHVGYISGVFDLFHIGHLNMFKRAKEQCDYLIVGVVRDEWVTCYKKTKTFIPFDERIEMVRSCRYVDQAEAIPLEYPGTRDAWRMYHFDVQFSGSDYVDDPSWLADKEFLEKRGAELVFFPYTEQTSSTKIKALISQHLV